MIAEALETFDNAPYETTLEDCRKWFDIINENLFEGKLPPVDEIDIRWRRGTHAYYEYEDDPKRRKHTSIKMNKRYRTKRLFVEILAHEMVHHWQYVMGHADSHGESFNSWKEPFQNKGLVLSEVVVIERK